MRALILGAVLMLVSGCAMFGGKPHPVTPPSVPPPPTDGSDPMAGFYGNTVIVTGGRPESHTRYKPDHTFDGVAPGFGFHYQGTWEITADGRVCRNFDPEPPTVNNPDCDATAAVARKVGDTWTNEDGDKFELVTGIQ